jgi:NADPH:quinone reductase-like Zn-dependent oxidoreductase
VVDNVGVDGELYLRCHEFTKVGAVFVMVGGTPSWGFFLRGLDRKFRPGFLGGGRRRYMGFFPRPEAEDLTQIVEWMKEGKVKAVIDQRFKFEEAVKAIERLKTSRARGKVVVDVAVLGELNSNRLEQI